MKTCCRLFQQEEKICAELLTTFIFSVAKCSWLLHMQMVGENIKTATQMNPVWHTRISFIHTQHTIAIFNTLIDLLLNSIHSKQCQPPYHLSSSGLTNVNSIFSQAALNMHRCGNAPNELHAPLSCCSFLFGWFWARKVRRSNSFVVKVFSSRPIHAPDLYQFSGREFNRLINRLSLADKEHMPLWPGSGQGRSEGQIPLW